MTVVEPVSRVSSDEVTRMLRRLSLLWRDYTFEFLKPEIAFTESRMLCAEVLERWQDNNYDDLYQATLAVIKKGPYKPLNDEIRLRLFKVMLLPFQRTAYMKKIDQALYENGADEAIVAFLRGVAITLMGKPDCSYERTRQLILALWRRYARGGTTLEKCTDATLKRVRAKSPLRLQQARKIDVRRARAGKTTVQFTIPTIAAQPKTGPDITARVIEVLTIALAESKPPSADGTLVYLTVDFHDSTGSTTSNSRRTFQWLEAERTLKEIEPVKRKSTKPR
jgi:hypothetical protein